MQEPVLEEVQELVQQVRCGARRGTSPANSMTKHAAVDLILATEEKRLCPRHFIPGCGAEGPLGPAARHGGVSLDDEEVSSDIEAHA